MATLTLEINGLKIEADSEKTILEVVTANNLDTIPTLCHSPELKPYGSCFLCVVEVAGRPSLVPACATRVAEGMKVTTRNERIIGSRRTALELLLSNHYADCVSPCAMACPAGVDCQGYVALAAMGEYGHAARLIREMNPLPAVCGRVCVRTCEIECRRADVDEPVGINAIKRFVTDQPGAYDEAPQRMPSRGRSVGIVGSGPAGLTAAWYLGLFGYDPVIYEALPKPGGMLRYGIPEYRLPNDVIDREIEYIRRAGAVLRMNVRIGADVTLAELMTTHAAVFIAAGAMGSKGMGVEGEETTEGVVKGVDFLMSKVESHEPMKGIVVVVGGGNTAVDVARTSWRLGADRVIILYRRTKAEMPADKVEVEDCLKEGIEIMELAAPVALVAENGRLMGLRCIRMKLGEPDASGRRKPIPQEGSEFVLPCDLAVPAIGQEPVLAGLAGGPDAPKSSRWNTIVVDQATMKTNIPGLYAGGDVADDGPTVVVDAIRDGHFAALSIHEQLSGEKVRKRPFIVQKSIWAKPGSAELGEVKEAPRHEVHEIDVDARRGSFAEVSTGYEYEDVVHESGRCLACGCVVYDRCGLRLYAEEYDVDIKRYFGRIRKHKVDERHPHIIYDPNKCILCARCIRTCARVLPISALGLVGRGFKTEMRPAMNDPLVETNCISCGNCVDACPTGALTVKYPFPGRACLPTEDVETHCAFCSIACPLTVKKVDADRYYISKGDRPENDLCRYGRFGSELFVGRRRIEQPTARENGKPKAVALADAFARITAGLRSAARTHGPDAVGVFISPELSNEEMFLATRIAREGIGTNNIASLSLLTSGAAAGALDASLGVTASTADRAAVKAANLIVCNNTDLQNDHLILSIEILAAAGERAKLIVAGSAGDALANRATLALDPMRGRSALLWNGVMQVLLDRGFFSRDAVRKLPGGEGFLSDLFDYSPQAISELTGVEAPKIIAAADELAAAKKVVFIHSPDRAQDQAPGDAVALANMVILLRSKGIGADLVLPFVGSNGAAVEIIGADPGFLAGRMPANGLPGAKSRADLLALLKDGRLKAALIVGEDPMRDDKVASYFGNAEFLAVLDWTPTETTEYADVVLPGSTFLESGGTRINFEGRLTRYTQALRPPFGAATAEVLAGLAKAFGIEDAGGTIDEITAGLDRLMRAHLGDRVKFTWNTGEARGGSGAVRLNVADVRTKPSPIAPPLTVAEHYKRQVREVGVAHYRVQGMKS
jgi:formate dehydrogenase major subunit